jgi:hypothetical protein
MIYQVTVQPEAFQEIEQSYRWLCDNRTPDLANDWYNDTARGDRFIENLSSALSDRT